MSGSAVLSRPAEMTEIVRMCCHCRRVRGPHGWQAEDVPADRWVSHGICRECYGVYYPEFPLPDGGD